MHQFVSREQSLRNGFNMLQLKLKDTRMTQALIPKFSKFLATQALEVVDQYSKEQGVLVLFINARLFGQVQYVTNLAQSFFDKEIIEVRTATPIFSSETRSRKWWQL